jgi:PhzF family phenazine biosynthesis protein
MQRRFAQVDVFTDRPYYGNPLAVVVDGEGLSTEDMQRIANWTNLSETTFLLPPADPAADYRVRIFTTTEELPFAGHPTLGSCDVWRAHGGVPRTPGVVVQECGVGLVTIQERGSRRYFAAPPMRRSGPLSAEERAMVRDSLGVRDDEILDCAWVDNGPGWMGVLLPSAERVLALKAETITGKVGVIGAHPAGSPYAYELRAFYSAGGVTFEDPVTGSVNASAAQWLLGAGRFTAPYVVQQGTALGRAGRVHIETDVDGAVWVGGDVVSCVRGTLAPFVG